MGSWNPHPKGVVMLNGYAGPGWEWPKAGNCNAYPFICCSSFWKRLGRIAGSVYGCMQLTINIPRQSLPPYGGPDQSRTLRVRILYYKLLTNETWTFWGLSSWTRFRISPLGQNEMLNQVQHDTISLQMLEINSETLMCKYLRISPRIVSIYYCNLNLTVKWKR